MRIFRLFLSTLFITTILFGMSAPDIISPKPEPTNTRIPKGISVQKIINKYYESRGGKKKVLAVNDLKYIMVTKYDGMPIVDTVWQKQPHLYNSSIYYYTVGKTTIYNGTKSEARDVYGVRELKDAELDELVLQSHLNPFLNLEKLGITAKLDGLKKFKDSDCYVIKLTFASGNVIRVYFDMKSGLKVREERDVSDANGQVHLKATDYFDYRGQNGVKFPAKIVQTTDGQGLSFTVTTLEANHGIDDENFVFRK
jgi:zinc protease